MAGVPIVQVQQWLGHSTIAMTMRYAHLAPGSGAGHIKALESGHAAQNHGNLTATQAG
jgi:integrase